MKNLGAIFMLCGFIGFLCSFESPSIYAMLYLGFTSAIAFVAGFALCKEFGCFGK